MKSIQSSDAIQKIIYLTGLVCVLVTGYFIYSNTFDNEFIFDDRNMILENPIIRNLNIPFIFNHGDGRFFGYLTFALNFYFHQFNVAGYHVINLAIHLVNGILVFWLVSHLSRVPIFENSILFKRRRLIGILTSLVFITHPVQTQAVSYVVQRFTSLSTLFYVLSFCLYLSARLNSNRTALFSVKRIKFALSFLVFLMGILTKESVFSLPVMICVTEFAFFKSISLSKIPVRFWWIGAVIVVILLSFLAKFHSFTDIFSPVYAYAIDEEISSWTYFINQFYVILKYLGVLIYPVNLVLDYGLRPEKSVFSPNLYLSFIGIFLVVGFAIRNKKKNPLFAFSVFWFLITLSIESSIIPIADLMVEHRLYLPSIGYILLLVSTLFAFFRGKLIIIPIILILGISVVFSKLTIARNETWQNAFTMWDDNVKKTPMNPRPYSSRGIEYSVNGEIEKGFEDFNKAIELNPNYVNALGNRAKYYQSKGMYEKAVTDYTKALESDAGYEHIWLNSRSTVYTLMGEWKLALQDINQSIDLIPLNVNNYLKRGDIKKELGDLEGAVKNYSMALQLQPNYGMALFNRMKTYLLMKEYKLARRDFQTCLDWQLPIDMNYIQQVNAELDKHFGDLSSKPNFLFISTFGLDTRLLKYLDNTQSLLIDDGTTFNNAFTTTPQYNGSLMSILTGNNSHQTMQEDLWYDKILASSLDDSTMATALSERGYRTIFIGKYFDGYAGMPKFQEKTSDPDFPIPLIDSELDPYEFGIPPGWSHWHGITHFNPDNEIVFSDDAASESYSFTAEDAPLNDLLYERAVPYLPRSESPFFMWINYPSFLTYKKYDPILDQIPNEKAEYMIESDLSDKPQYVRNFEKSNQFTESVSMDLAESYYNRLIRQYKTFDLFIGKLLDELNQLGQTDNTVIILTSGVGGGISNRYHWQAYLTPYDENIRVPLIMRGANIMGGLEVSQVVSNMDIFATILDFCGINPPWQSDSRSLKEVLTTGNFPNNQLHRTIFTELWNIRHHRWNSLPPRYRLFRTDEYKYIEYETGEFEYYDLKSDPMEFENLYYILTKQQKQSLADELSRQLGKGYSNR
ncbi:MAG: sulfatase-like hydrolase/transferase [Fidelibacterota bacterium]